MTWEQAHEKYGSSSPSVQGRTSLSGGRPLSPAPLNSKPVFTQDPQEMDVDPPAAQQPGRPPLSDARIRTPLPSAPRPDKPSAIAPLPGVDSLKSSELQASISRILTSPFRSRYAAVSALLLNWQEDSDINARSAMSELGDVLERDYNYTFQIRSIPASSDGCKNSWRWLSREVTDFIGNQDQRDVLKIVYYSGHSYLDGNREMVLARCVSLSAMRPPLSY